MAATGWESIAVADYAEKSQKEKKKPLQTRDVSLQVRAWLCFVAHVERVGMTANDSTYFTHRRIEFVWLFDSK